MNKSSVNTKASTKILWTVFFTIFLDMFGIGILIPIYPMLVTPASIFKITPNSWSIADGYIMAGWLMTMFPLMQFIFTPILGQLADRYGRRNILALSVSGTIFSYVLFAIGILSKNIPLIFIARALDGITGANIAVAQAVIGDISEPKARAKNFGLIGLALGLGFILGPFFGGKLSDSTNISWFTIATPFWFAAILNIFNLLLVLTCLPETLKVEIHRRLDISRPINNIIKAFSHGQLKNIIPAIFLFNAGFTFFTTFWGIVLATKFGFGQDQIGNFFGFTGLMIVLSQGLIVRRISGKITDYKVLNLSIIGTGICILGYFFTPYLPHTSIYLITPFLAVCSATTRAFSAALITRITPSNMIGEAMGINSSANALAQAIPACLAGYIAAHQATTPILVGAITTILGGLLFRRMFKPQHLK